MARTLTLFAFAALLQTTAAWAQTNDMPSVSFDGFGTAGVVYSDEDQADFRSDTLAADGAGYSRQLSPEVDSRVALQVTANFTSKFSSIVQAVVEQGHDESYTPTLEWANLKYDVTDHLYVRAGRMVLPAFMTSEYRKVGFAIPWVRPPQEVYALLPVSNFDGVSITQVSRFAGFTNTLHGSYGRRDVDTPNIGEIEARNGLTLADTLEWGPVSLFLQYSRFRASIDDLTPLFDGFRQFGTAGQAVAERNNANDKVFDVVTLGARYDVENWFVMGEWTQSQSRTFIPDKQGWYVTGGWRYDSVTPYVTLAGVRTTGNAIDPGVPNTGLSAPAAAQATRLNTSLNDLQRAEAAQQQRISLGIRWDFAPNKSLKLQYDHVNLDNGSAGFLTNVQPGFEPGGTFNVFSVAVDFVF